MNPIPVDLHLGAHKTATTHLQQHWVKCSTMVPDVRCPPLDEVRSHLTAACATGQAPARAAAAAWLAATLEKTPQRLVISEENLLGDCLSNLRAGALYPDAAARAGRAASLLGKRPVRLFLSVRAYAPTFRSSFCEAIRHAPYRPFRQAWAGGFDAEEGGWEALAQRLLIVFPESELHVWRYEDLEDVRPRITRMMFGLPPGQQPRPDEEHSRRSLSKMAVRLLDDLHARHGAEYATKARHSVEKLVDGPKLHRFDPWTDAERAEFEASDARSLAALRAMPRVKFIDGQDARNKPQKSKEETST